MKDVLSTPIRLHASPSIWRLVESRCHCIHCIVGVHQKRRLSTPDASQLQLNEPCVPLPVPWHHSMRLRGDETESLLSVTSFCNRKSCPGSPFVGLLVLPSTFYDIHCLDLASS